MIDIDKALAICQKELKNYFPRIIEFKSDDKIKSDLKERKNFNGLIYWVDDKLQQCCFSIDISNDELILNLYGWKNINKINLTDKLTNKEMSLIDTINEDVKSSMKEKNSIKLNAVRAIKAEITKEATSGKTAKELTDEDVLKVIQRMVKQRTDSIEQYKQANRQDLVDEEEAQLAYIKEYMPKQLTNEEITALISKAIANGAKNLGEVMKAIKSDIAGKANGKTVSDIAKKILA